MDSHNHWRENLPQNANTAETARDRRSASKIVIRVTVAVSTESGKEFCFYRMLNAGDNAIFFLTSQAK